MTFLEIAEGHETKLPPQSGGLERCHVFDADSIDAVNAALASGRPLLVRGEPGVGKTQLAEAVAKELQRAFIAFVVDARTESRNLLWSLDAVRRLGEAQICGVLGRDEASVRDQLALARFVHPRALWWAFDWDSAQKAASEGTSPLSQGNNNTHKARGWVVLIDEIDKGESDVPNGLLEALGAGQFTPEGHDTPVRIKGPPPLVVITTNEERVLPDAFLRRTIVLPLALPTNRADLEAYLMSRGKAHFGEHASEEILQSAAEQLILDRDWAREHQLTPLPGQAEYLDLIRAVIRLRPKDPKAQRALLKKLARFTLQKHPEMHRAHPREVS